MATEADLIQKFKDLDIPVGADFEELIHEAFIGANLVDQVNSKADDSKVVHTADMRKPANQVASIDEVNAKQDKIGYTPADDSKVVHNSGDETIGGTKTFANPIKGTIGGIAYQYNAQGDDLDTSYMNDSVIFAGGEPVAHAPAGTDGKMAVIINHNADVNNGAQSYYDTNTSTLYFRVRNDGSKYFPWIKLADDSKVAHLSGTNNFTGSIQHNGNPVGAHIQASNNDEDSAISDSTKGNSDDIYYWLEN